MNLLLVDDEEDLIENIIFDLKDENYVIFVANDGQAALEVLKSQNIDCIVTDIKMPIKSGLAMAKEARNLGFKKPIIFLTAHGEENLMREAVSCFAHDFIHKPYQPYELKLVIKEALGSFDKPKIYDDFEDKYKKFLN